MITITGYSQTIDRNNVIARQKLQYSGGNPDSNKIAVSVDANGIFKWVYFTDFQDSVNTGIYDTTTANVVVTQAIRITGATFASDTLVSIGTSGTVTKCFATCDTIQYILDNLGGGGDYSPWDTIVDGADTFIVQKNLDYNVGIGTISPSKLLDVRGGIYQENGTGDNFLFLTSDADDDRFEVEGFAQTLGLTTRIRQKIDEGYVSLYTEDGINNISSEIRALTNGDVIINWDSASNNVGIGTGTPTEKLHVAGTSLFTDTLTYANGTEADGYVLTSDASGNATWQDPTAYGEMGFGDSTRTIALTQNVFSVVTNTANDLWSTAAVDLHNVTYSGDSLIIDSAGTYQVNVQLSMDGTSGSVIRLGVFLNGVLACSCTGYQELLNNRILQLTYINIDALNAGDVLQVVITNTANNDDVDAIGGKLMVNKIR
jgi:hypothetical protein